MSQTYTVSLVSNVTVNSIVVVQADSKDNAIEIATMMHNQGALIWKYNNIVIPTFNGPINSIWSSIGVTPPLGPQPINTVLAVNVINPIFGTNIVLTDTIAAGATGSVSFYSNNELLGVTTPDIITGIATLTTALPFIGVQHVKAVFAGDSLFLSNTSNIINVNTLSPSTTTAISSSSGPSTVITASVSSNFGIPDGLVIFYDNLIEIGTNILSEGICGIKITLDSGSHSLNAKYQGSSTYAPSTSNILVETI